MARFRDADGGNGFGSWSLRAFFQHSDEPQQQFHHRQRLCRGSARTQGEYLGGTAGYPHVTDEIKRRTRLAAEGEVLIGEVGGTVRHRVPAF